MDPSTALADRFEASRSRLRSVAYRMLGSASEAEDAVQEAWIRVSRAGSEGVDNLGGWLTTVVARVCLDMLRSRRSRREDAVGGDLPDSVVAGAGVVDPTRDESLADSIGPALVLVLDTLAPPERLAFVLHDMFAVPFDEIGPMVGRTPAAARQLASRARRRVQGKPPDPDAYVARHRAIVDAFLAASRDGDMGRLLALLDPDAVLHADGAAVRAGAAREVRGADAVAATFKGRARVARAALVDGAAGAVWMHGGQPRVVFAFTFAGGKIAEIELVADAATLAELDLVVPEQPGSEGA